MIIGDLIKTLELVGKQLERHKVDKATRIMDKVMVAIYDFGEEGQCAVYAEEFISKYKHIFTKTEIYEAINLAEKEGFIFVRSDYYGLKWWLKPIARLYVEGLLEGRV